MKVFINTLFVSLFFSVIVLANPEGYMSQKRFDEYFLAPESWSHYRIRLSDWENVDRAGLAIWRNDIDGLIQDQERPDSVVVLRATKDGVEAIKVFFRKNLQRPHFLREQEKYFNLLSRESEDALMQEDLAGVSEAMPPIVFFGVSQVKKYVIKPTTDRAQEAHALSLLDDNTKKVVVEFYKKLTAIDGIDIVSRHGQMELVIYFSSESPLQLSYVPALNTIEITSPSAGQTQMSQVVQLSNAEIIQDILGNNRLQSLIQRYLNNIALRATPTKSVGYCIDAMTSSIFRPN